MSNTHSRRFQKNRKPKLVEASSLLPDVGRSSGEKFESIKLENEIDERMGFAKFESGPKRAGWLVNMHATHLYDETANGNARAAMDYYFLDGEGGSFKATLTYDPYFLIACKADTETEVEDWCKRKFEPLVRRTERVLKEDLSMPNHLTGYRRTYIKLIFDNTQDLVNVRKTLLPLAEANMKKVDAMEIYQEVANYSNQVNGSYDFFDNDNETRKRTVVQDPADCIIDIREYDVLYHVRVAIDKDIRVGKWYWVEAKHGVISLSCIEDRLAQADPVVMAYDIETTHLPLKFPDATIDQITMISYMIDGQGFLIVNRDIVSADIEDFEYTPKPEYKGEFITFNEPDERSLIERFFEHIKEAKPTVIATYNGDFFDWEFVEKRAGFLGIDMLQEIGFRKTKDDVYSSNYCVHMDAFAWVNRDSYLPQGSRGLKEVTRKKLGYDPDELDPEEMMRYATEKPQTLAEYSVSDAVATYYLYMKYVHPFIFALTTIVPFNAEDTMRKGTGTLCEMLLMVQAYQSNIVFPNKHVAPIESFYEGHLLNSETYVGGHVEAIETGIFRSDIPVNFKVIPETVEKLIADLDVALKFTITVENKKKLEDVENYEEVKENIQKKLEELKNTPNRKERPLIYHLDVASMYPNIMITNRLQPDSMVEESDCAACDFNRPGKTCDRRLEWAWRGEYLPAKKDDYNMIRGSLLHEKFPGRFPNSPPRTFDELSAQEQAAHIKKRLQDYSKKTYHRLTDSKTIVKESIVCQRENPFYANTVKAFRDRRYDFKTKNKIWKGKTDELIKSGAPASSVEEAKKLVTLFDSMQLAHKVILNSFYGYVMRKGSRWYSMEMAGITCLTGARIIQMARELVEDIGRPLELDTDGIWCMLPGSFPEEFAFKLRGGKKLVVSYPCVMLNFLVHARFTNHQYQTLADPKTFRYETHSENSIFFEIDGPYLAMILPTSLEEDVNLKKRYAVFNLDGSVAEIKGFEMKRRSELKLVQKFQEDLFRFFLNGRTLDEAYASAAKVADRWLDIIDKKGSTLADDDLYFLICESRSMSKSLEEYGAQKSLAITTAKRIAEFLGEKMIKDKGLNCKYIISAKPRGLPVTERAVPVAIFQSPEDQQRMYLRKWLKEEPADLDPRAIIDWDYYRERLAKQIQKIITMPAALQGVRNPVPRVPHPEWLQRRINVRDDKFKQKKMTDLFASAPKDMEDFGSTPSGTQKPIISSASKVIGKRKAPVEAAPIDLYASLPPMPDPDRDYCGFLKWQKQKWKIQKVARDRRRQLFGDRTGNQSDHIGSFFRNQAEMLFSSTWEILQIRESEIPGEVKAWVLMDKRIIPLKFKVPREIFVNFKSLDVDVDIAGVEVEKVYHTLPSGHQAKHLFKLTMDEQLYVSKANEFRAVFSHPSVEGVYGTQLPLATKALLHLGATCTFDTSQQGALGKCLESGFDLKLLERVSAPYLAGTPLAYTFIHHIVSGDRQIFSIFSTSSEGVLVYILNTGKDTHPLPNMSKQYSDLLAERLNKNDGEPWQSVIEYPSELKFTTKNIGTFRKLQKELSTFLKNLKESEAKSMIFVVHSPQRGGLVADFAVLQDSPVLSVQQDPDVLPLLGWQAYAAKRIVSRILKLGAIVENMQEMARFGGVPLCNVKEDVTFLIDVAYARQLEAANVVLWWSSRPVPDHGGCEDDDAIGQLTRADLPRRNERGSYSTVCIEVRIRHLEFNALLSTAAMNRLEMIESEQIIGNSAEQNGESDEAGGPTATEDRFSTNAIKVLQDLIEFWRKQAVDWQNQAADILLAHLPRWLRNRSAYLYDRTLHYYVDQQSDRCFRMLVAAMKKVGAEVIFGSASRLVLKTTKLDVGNAYGFVNFIMPSFKKDEDSPFKYLDLTVQHFWDYLVWYDDVNYGGYLCTEVTAADTQEFMIDMHWQMGRILPEDLYEHLKEFATQFIEIMYGEKQRKIQALVNGEEPRSTQIPTEFFTSLTNTQEPAKANGKEEPILTDTFTKPLKKIVNKLIKIQRDALQHGGTPWELDRSRLPGCSHTTTDPILHLVKCLTVIFDQPRETKMDARILRKELLNMFNIREFSKDGEFENPSGIWLFPQIMCEHCSEARDIDLCRDEELFPTVDQAGRLQIRPWVCLHCGSEFDRAAIEQRMISDVYGLVLKYQSQDLVCLKCKTQQTNQFQDHCGCGNEWECEIKATDIIKRLMIAGRLAETYGMNMVGKVVAEITETLKS